MLPWSPPGVQIPNDVSIGSAVFAQLTTKCLYTVQCAALPRLKIAPSHGDLDPHLIYGSLGPPKSWTLTASRSDLLFCRSHYCDRQTNRPHTWSDKGCICVCSTAMQPDDNNNALVTLVFPMKNPRAMRPLIKIFLTTCYCYYYCLNNYRIHISFMDGTLSEVMTIF